MAYLTRLLLSAIVLTGSFTDITSVSAFATPLPSSYINQKTQVIPTNTMSTLRNRGGDSAATKVAATPSGGGDPAAKKKKMRITAFDSMRFFLIACIVLGHFIKFANPSEFVFKLFSQHNAIVGAFFALSGYVTAYTTTENAERAASPKLLETPKQKWILSRVFGYFPLYLVTLILFSPMFLFADVHYNGWLQAAFHGFLSVTMTQAWFPMHSEIWNAPTWFLSALTFATALMPFGLPSIAKMDKKQLCRTGWWLWLVSLLPKIGYAYDFKAWTIFEGVMSPKVHPNMAVFNMQRFSPLMLASEVLLGAVACRLVMLDDAPGEGQPKTNALSTLFPLACMLGLFWGRAAGLYELSDLLFRTILFVPLFLRFLMSAHRNTVKAVKDPIVWILSNKFLVFLGNLSFPIYIAHGPIGQVFYKKLIANKVFGKVLMGPANFGIYLATTLVSAWILQQLVLKNKAVGDWSKKTVDQLSSWM